MDSFIFYNAESDPSTEVYFLSTEPEEIINEKSTVQIQEIIENNDTSDTQEKPEESKKQDLPINQIPETPDTNYEHEILCHLEFDGSINKLGARAGV